MRLFGTWNLRGRAHTAEADMDVQHSSLGMRVGGQGMELENSDKAIMYTEKLGSYITSKFLLLRACRREVSLAFTESFFGVQLRSSMQRANVLAANAMPVN